MPKTISFTTNMWGHAFHATTWHQETADRVIRRALDWITGTRRYSVMVHSSDFPTCGDLIQYKAEGGVATAKIYAVEPCGNPRDMFTLRVLRDRVLDRRFNQLAS